MASRVLAAIDSSAFGAFTGIFRNYGPQVIHGLIIVSTISGQSLIGKLTFDCPCAYPLNIYLSIAFIFGPSIVLFVFALIINPQTWQILHGYYYRTTQIRHSMTATCKQWLQILEQSFIAPVAWIFVAFLNGNYYNCMKAAKFCNKNYTNLCNDTVTLEEAATLDLTNDNSENNICPLCLCSLDPKHSRYLRSESQVIAWIFITVIAIIALVSICLIRIFDKHTYIQWKFIQMYQKEEKRIFDETSKEFARKVAEKQADIFFNKEIHSKKDWDSLSILHSFQHTSKNRNRNNKNLYGDEIFTALQRWVYKYKVMPIYTANQHEIIQEFPDEQLDLSADGLAIHEKLLNSNECENLQKNLYRYLAEISSNQKTPFNINQPKTYRIIYDYFPTRKLLLQNFNFGHNPLSWYVRCNEKIQEKFAQIYGIQQRISSENGKSSLVTSFDGVSIIPPCEQTKMGWHEGNSKLHCDQSFSTSSFQCVQGQVPIFDVNKGDATLRALRGSHLLHSDFADAFHLKNVPNDWTALTQEQIQWYRDRLDADADIYITCPKGSLVLWDSRTIHDGTKPQKWRAEPNWRCTLFVCMQPRINDPLIAKKRESAFDSRRNTTHDPNKVQLFPINPRTYGREFIPPMPIKLEDYGLSLEKIKSLV